MFGAWSLYACCAIIILLLLWASHTWWSDLHGSHANQNDNWVQNLRYSRSGAAVYAQLQKCEFRGVYHESANDSASHNKSSIAIVSRFSYFSNLFLIIRILQKNLKTVAVTVSLPEKSPGRHSGLSAAAYVHAPSYSVIVVAAFTVLL